MSFCKQCTRELIPLEKSLNQKLINRDIQDCYCKTCLANLFKTTESKLDELAEYYKKTGCVLFQYNDVCLRKFQDEDVELFCKWLKEDHVSKWFNYSSWYNEIIDRKAKYSFINHFIVEYNNKPIGFCQYYDYSLGGEDWHKNLDITRTCSIDYMIGDRDYIGKKIAPKMINELIKIIGKEHKYDKIIVQPETENIVSRRLLLKSGFTYMKEYDIFIMKI